LPWAEFMNLGLGAMRMTPEEFWNCSFEEFYSAIDGFRTFNGADRDKPMTKDELDELMELHPD
tara:strand:+ start:547 stop:735 length:189 start_codon:yes stop_codon:yes gene_type:complete